MKLDIQQVLKKKESGQKIAMLTCYDYAFARLLNNADLDVVLVGDSVGTNVLGYADVTAVTMQDMLHHLRAVARGATAKFILCDMPYRSYESASQALANARMLIEGGATAVKMEGGKEIAPCIAALTAEGIGVCAHIGFTPQKGGKAAVQGKDPLQAKALLDSALVLQENGACMMVLELMPPELAGEITNALKIPTIGIGAGSRCDGQVQVLYDIMGFPERVFRHAKVFAPVRSSAEQAIAAFATAVKRGEFPESFTQGSK
ncbi:MAG: 3-methyl-2-oxobutanoate hydroxymethyltransferase [Chitinivibrionales bacterium]|nr:3-methyl-2-oxobutanoate hydroxymethyltransferase [Chitinivibrionales bacterium]